VAERDGPAAATGPLGQDRTRPWLSELPPWRRVPASPQVQVDPAALEREVVDLAPAVVLAAGGWSFVLHYLPMLRVHPSARRHGCTIEDISHAVDMALYEDVLDEDNDPPKLLFIGPDAAGNLLELIGGVVENDDLLIWHAMRCRAGYLALLPKPGGKS
jgi:hypothetical protein